MRNGKALASADVWKALSVCGVRLRHSVHSVFRESLMQAGRQTPFSWSTNMFYLSGVAKQAVCLTQQQQPHQQQKSQDTPFFSTFSDWWTLVLQSNVLGNVCPVIYFPQWAV